MPEHIMNFKQNVFREVLAHYIVTSALWDYVLLTNQELYLANCWQIE